MKVKKGQEVIVENPWWAKNLKAIRCEIRKDGNLLSDLLITVQPLEGNPHTRDVRPNTIRVQPLDTDRGPTSSVECDHEWEVIDDSFDHEYGCEVIVFERCEFCGAERSHEPMTFDDDVI